MAEKVLATLVVDFDSTATVDGVSGRIILEVDGRDDGMNGGNTTANHTRPLYLFLIPDFVTIDTKGLTSGLLTYVRDVTFQHEEWLVFQNQSEAQLRYPPTGAVAWVPEGTVMSRPIGEEGADYTAYGAGLSLATRGISRMVANRDLLGIYKATYTVTAPVYSLTRVPTDIEKVLIWSTGTTLE